MRGARGGPCGMLLALVALAVASLVGARAGAEPFTLFMSPEQEARIGREEHPKILAEMGGVYDDPRIGGYVAVVGGSLVANSEMPRRPFRFTVLNTPIVNAFALPGGYVYVTRGLLALANSEAELAGVLAHEIGHVTARHGAQRYSRGVIAGLGAAVLGAITESPQLGRLAQVAGGLYLSGFSREQEYEADLLGVKYLARTGYEPSAQARFLRALEVDQEVQARLAGKGGRDTGLDLFATHPRTADRVRAAIRAAGSQGAASGAPERRDDYLREIDGLMYGDDPAQGLVRGRTFSHPVLGFTFRAPADFRLVNRSDAVIGRDPNGAAMMFDGDTRPRREPMTRYLAEAWLAPLATKGLEPITIGGFEAATATARAELEGGARELRAVALRYSESQIFRFLFAAPPALSARYDEAYRRTVFSFRRLAPAEIAELKPSRIRIVRVAVGETVAGLASRMELGSLHEARFRALNGLGPGDRLTPGQAVKLVRE